MPHTRSGRWQAEAMAVIGSEDVLEAMIVSGPGHGVEPGKQYVFDLEALGDGFDDDAGLRQGQ